MPLKIIFIVVLIAHALIHLMGATKAFGWASIDTIHQPITKPVGIAWLAATGLLLTSATLLAFGSRSWWVAAAPAILVSQLVIVGAWHDARFGTIANVVILVPLALAILDLRPSSLRSTYERAIEVAFASVSSHHRSDPVSQDDLRVLPTLVGVGSVVRAPAPAISQCALR